MTARHCRVAALFCLVAACSPAQVAKVETGIPADAALVGCVLQNALTTGGNVAAIAFACSADALAVARILWEAGTLPARPTKGDIAAAQNIRSSAAYRDAVENYPYCEGVK